MYVHIFLCMYVYAYVYTYINPNCMCTTENTITYKLINEYYIYVYHQVTLYTPSHATSR